MTTIPESELQQLAALMAEPLTSIPATTCGIDSVALAEAVRLFRDTVFEGYFGSGSATVRLRRLYDTIVSQTACALRLAPGGQTPEEIEQQARHTADRLLAELPRLRRMLATDVQALFDGDPAATGFEEVILCYPALNALTHYRLAHALHRLGVPLLPRIITEQAHSATGIDIHPNASIGEYFSIDHGTGVVIGQTCIIGRHVRLYQGVTLGAKSFKFDADGHPLDEPRHPIIEDHVVVYSNASILGRIRIGHHSVIGGNIWQTSDVPPYSRVIQGRATVSTFEDGSGI